MHYQVCAFLGGKCLKLLLCQQLEVNLVLSCTFKYQIYSSLCVLSFALCTSWCSSLLIHKKYMYLFYILAYYPVITQCNAWELKSFFAWCMWILKKRNSFVGIGFSTLKWLQSTMIVHKQIRKYIMEDIT